MKERMRMNVMKVIILDRNGKQRKLFQKELFARWGLGDDIGPMQKVGCSKVGYVAHDQRSV